MSKVFGKLPRISVLISILALTALAAWAARAVNVTASLAESCPNCQTDRAGMYSLTPDAGGQYSPVESGVQSQILTNNSVYTLDTTATLVGGLVAPSTRTVEMHFYSSVECKPPYVGCMPPASYPNNILPPCWGGIYNQNQAVNWSVFAPVSFLSMSTSPGAKYQGMARLNFNVRTPECDRQINRFRLEWPVVCITRTSPGRWAVTSQSCSLDVNWGEAHLQGYGGTKRNTVDYGDWRMPFVLNLVK